MGNSAPYISPDTRVTADNWPILQQMGVQHLTNADTECHGLQLIDDATVVREELAWELGADRLLSGDPFITRHGGPTDLPDFCGLEGFYAMHLPAGWTYPQERYVSSKHPQIVRSGLQHLLPTGDHYRWSIWRVFGYKLVYRCFCIDDINFPRFEGTLEEIIAFIRAKELEFASHH